MRRRRRRVGTGVDITPLIDVLFMLIIFFVLTTAFVQGAIHVDLPDGTSSTVPDGNPIVLTVDRSGDLFWAGKRIGDGDLALYVRDALVKSEDILLAGDKGASYGRVASLLAQLRHLGVKDLGLAFGAER